MQRGAIQGSRIFEQLRPLLAEFGLGLFLLVAEEALVLGVEVQPEGQALNVGGRGVSRRSGRP